MEISNHERELERLYAELSKEGLPPILTQAIQTAGENDYTHLKFILKQCLYKSQGEPRIGKTLSIKGSKVTYYSHEAVYCIKSKIRKEIKTWMSEQSILILGGPADNFNGYIDQTLTISMSLNKDDDFRVSSLRIEAEKEISLVAY